MTPEERAAAIAAAVGPNPIQYTFNGIVFNVSDCHAVGSAVYVTVSAWTGTGAKKSYLPVDNPYIFVNPPLQVPDGQGGYARNDIAAAQQIVYDTVVAVAQRMGWTP